MLKKLIVIFEKSMTPFDQNSDNNNMVDLNCIIFHIFMLKRVLQVFKKSTVKSFRSSTTVALIHFRRMDALREQEDHVIITDVCAGSLNLPADRGGLGLRFNVLHKIGKHHIYQLDCAGIKTFLKICKSCSLFIAFLF
mgnify:CR=1 FL=1